MTPEFSSSRGEMAASGNRAAAGGAGPAEESKGPAGGEGPSLGVGPAETAGPGLARVLQDLDPHALGREMHALAADLYPLNRSRTGPGLRETLRRLKGLLPLDIVEVPSGTPVFDWTIPREWSVREAYLKAPSGRRVADFRRHNLHLVAYSAPVRAVLPLEQLRNRLHSLPDRPDWIPYRTAFHQETWGFCLPHRELASLEEGDYEVVIDASLEPGSLSYGELVLRGDKEDEVLIHTHCCHPSLANDNLSGITVAALLARTLEPMRLKHTFRFLFSPSVLGPIAWLSRNEARTSWVKHGLNLAGLGDSGNLTYKRSRRGRAPIDRAMEHVLKHGGEGHRIGDFTPYGYDERQFCSPGFNLPMGSLMRTPNGAYPEYHTSADDLDFIRPESLGLSLQRCLEAVAVLEGDGHFLNLNPKCEPQLGRRGIYRGLRGGGRLGDADYALLWVLNFSDGEHSLLDIAERSELAFSAIRGAADALLGAGLLSELKEEP